MKKFILSFMCLCALNVFGFQNKSPKDGLMEALEHHGVHHKEIVYAQALWETGHFKSKLCLTHNNLF